MTSQKTNGKIRQAKKKTADAVSAIKVLSNPARLAILRALLFAKEKDREMCVKEISETAGISQSAASHQLARLEDRGLVCSSRMGQMICYQICDSPFLAMIARIIKQLD